MPRGLLETKRYPCRRDRNERRARLAPQANNPSNPVSGPTLAVLGSAACPLVAAGACAGAGSGAAACGADAAGAGAAAAGADVGSGSAAAARCASNVSRRAVSTSSSRRMLSLLVSRSSLPLISTHRPSIDSFRFPFSGLSS